MAEAFGPSAPRDPWTVVSPWLIASSWVVTDPTAVDNPATVGLAVSARPVTFTMRSGRGAAISLTVLVEAFSVLA